MSMSFGKIIATARYLPERVVTNDDLAEWMETSDEWIQSRTGIKQRHIAEVENTYQQDNDRSNEFGFHHCCDDVS